MKKIVSAINARIILGLSQLPLGFLYFFSDLIFILMAYIARYRRRVIMQNLRMAFPDKSPQFYAQTCRKFYRHLSDFFIETTKNLGRSSEAVQSRIRFVNLDLLQNYFSRGQSIILYGGHIGNWEWLNAIPKINHDVTVGLYQPLASSFIDELTRKAREKNDTLIVPSARAFKSLKNLNDGGKVTLTFALGDQSPPPHGPKVWIDFMGIETAFLPGINKIAQKLGQTLMYPHYIKTGRGRYDVEFKLIYDGVTGIYGEQIIESYGKLLENNIRQQPHIWLWSHRRWKLTREEG